MSTNKMGDWETGRLGGLHSSLSMYAYRRAFHAVNSGSEET